MPSIYFLDLKGVLFKLINIFIVTQMPSLSLGIFKANEMQVKIAYWQLSHLKATLHDFAQCTYSTWSKEETGLTQLSEYFRLVTTTPWPQPIFVGLFEGMPPHRCTAGTSLIST
jgi:hypothetical protein